MQFPHAQPVFRHRFPLIPDPYNPERQVRNTKAAPQTIPLRGFIASSSSVALQDPNRSQSLTDKSLYLTDVTADVIVGDLIGTTEEASAAEYQVDVIPSADMNPFTGWQPAKEIPLEGVKG